MLNLLVHLLQLQIMHEVHLLDQMLFFSSVQVYYSIILIYYTPDNPNNIDTPSSFDASTDDDGCVWGGCTCGAAAIDADSGGVIFGGVTSCFTSIGGFSTGFGVSVFTVVSVVTGCCVTVSVSSGSI